jgi:hypothetical protein
MSATTIKLESQLVEKVAALKCKGESISGYVRSLIEREHRALQHQAAARSYQQFLDEHPEERAALESWESAPLIDEVEPRQP